MTDFHRMRQDLAARGLLDSQYRLTSDGEAYSRQILEAVKNAQHDGAPAQPVRWITGGRSI